jgi:hypothetical protein
MSLAYCPDCGRLMSTEFPLHDCRPKTNMKKELLPLDSPLYIKRIVREIKAQLRAGKSVYAKNETYKFKVLEVLTDGVFLYALDPMGIATQFEATDIFDHNGQQICASREL